MAESSKTTESGSGGSLSGFRFNSTGNDTTTEVITPKVSAADRTRRTLLITVVTVIIGVLAFAAYNDSKSLGIFAPQKNPGAFGPGERQMPR